MKRCLRRRFGKGIHDPAHVAFGHRRKHRQGENLARLRLGVRAQSRFVAQLGVIGVQIDRRIMDIGADAFGAQPREYAVAVDAIRQSHNIEMIGVRTIHMAAQWPYAVLPAKA